MTSESAAPSKLSMAGSDCDSQNGSCAWDLLSTLRDLISPIRKQRSANRLSDTQYVALRSPRRPTRYKDRALWCLFSVSGIVGQRGEHSRPSIDKTKISDEHTRQI